MGVFLKIRWLKRCCCLIFIGCLPFYAIVWSVEKESPPGPREVNHIVHKTFAQSITCSTGNTETAKVAFSNTAQNPGQKEMTSYSKVPQDHPQQPTQEAIKNFPQHFLPNITSSCWREPGSNSTDELLCMPYFFLAGFPKCGTTDVHTKLWQHPGIIKPVKKEPGWWTGGRHQGVSVSDYVTNFKTLARKVSADYAKYSTSHLITGDSTVANSWKSGNWRDLYPGQREPPYVTADVIRRLLPKSKIILLIRNPTGRLYSDYLYLDFLYRRKYGTERAKRNSVTFHKDVIESMAIYTSCIDKGQSMRVCSYDNADRTPARITIGHYVVFLRDWFRAFPRDQILVIRFEDWAVNCKKWLLTLYTFLDQEKLSDEAISTICRMKRKNIFRQKIQYGRLQNSTKELLDRWYKPFNSELAEFLHDNNYLWTS